MHNNTYMILDDNGVVIAQYMSLDIALILLRALCETYYADPTGWTIIADNIEVDNPSAVTWNEERQTWKQPPPTLLAKQVADIKKGIAGFAEELRYAASTSNNSKVVDEEKTTAEK